MTFLNWQFVPAVMYAGLVVFALIVYLRRLLIQLKSKPAGHGKLLERLSNAIGAKFIDGAAANLPARLNRAVAAGNPLLQLDAGLFGDQTAWITIERAHRRSLPRLLVVIGNEQLVRRKVRIEPRGNLSLFDTNGLPKVDPARFPFDQFLEHHHVFSDSRVYMLLRQHGVLRLLSTFYVERQKRVSLELRAGELALSLPFTGAERRLNGLFAEVVQLTYRVSGKLEECFPHDSSVLLPNVRLKRL